MVHEKDMERIVRGPNDLEETIEVLTKRVREAEGELTIIKGIGQNSPEMNEAKAENENLKFYCKQAEARIEELEKDREILKQDIDRLSEDKHNLEILLRSR